MFDDETAPVLSILKPPLVFLPSIGCTEPLEAPSLIEPSTSSLYRGVEIPTPTFPLASIMKGVVSGEVESSTTNEGFVVVFVIDNVAHGVEVAIPTLPVPPFV